MIGSLPPSPPLARPRLQEERGKLPGGDVYLLDVHHFIKMWADPSLRASQRAALPALPFDASDPDAEHLTIDARATGAPRMAAVQGCAGLLQGCAGTDL